MEELEENTRLLYVALTRAMERIYIVDTIKQIPEDERKMYMDLLKDSKLAFDLVYGIQTPFLNLAKNLHIPTQDGKMMLINQAILSFGIFMDSLKIAYCKNTLINSMQNAL